MPRPLRVEFEGAHCHVMNRADRHVPIFHDDADGKRFLETLAEVCAKTGWLDAALDFKLSIADLRFTPTAPAPAASTAAQALHAPVLRALQIGDL